MSDPVNSELQIVVGVCLAVHIAEEQKKSYGAAIVLAINDHIYPSETLVLVGTLDYLSHEKPSMFVFEERKWLILTHHAWQGTIDLHQCVLSEFPKFASRFEIVGITASRESDPRTSVGISSWNVIGDQVLLQKEWWDRSDATKTSTTSAAGNAKICAICEKPVPRTLTACPSCGSGVFASPKSHKQLLLPSSPTNRERRPEGKGLFAKLREAFTSKPKEPDKEQDLIRRLIENWLKNNRHFLGSDIERDEIRKSVLGVPIEAIVAANAIRCNQNKSMYSDYISSPDTPYSVNLMLFPGTFEEAKDAFYALYPKEGFFQYMKQKISASEAAAVDKQERGKGGVVFLLICMCQALEKTYVFVTLGLYPFKGTLNVISPF